MYFKLKAELTINQEGEPLEHNSYQLEYCLKLLKEDKSEAIFYDNDLGMYFEKPLGVVYTYEIETKNVNLSLCQRLGKATDFSQRLFYRYDWMELKVNGQGQPVAMQNRDELKDNWNRLMNRISEDYVGVMPRNDLDRLNEAYKKGHEPDRSINQHLHFALLFPRIPLSHHNDWRQKRLLRCSEFESECIYENVVYNKTENNLRYYTLSGELEPKSKAILLQYDGNLCMPMHNILPLKTDVKIEYIQGKQKIKWFFVLEQIEK